MVALVFLGQVGFSLGHRGDEFMKTGVPSGWLNELLILGTPERSERAREAERVQGKRFELCEGRVVAAAHAPMPWAGTSDTKAITMRCRLA
jgi:hypothetical protein